MTMERSRHDRNSAANVTPLPPARRAPPGERDDDRRVVGFGDHMPAFLARPGRRVRG